MPLNFKEKITGPRVELIRSRPLIETAQDIFELVDCNRSYLEPWFPWVKPTQKVEDSLKFLFDKEQETEQSKNIGYMLVLDQQAIGHISIFKISAKDKSGEIGYWISADYSRKGYMTEAVKLLTKEAFENLGINRVQIRCDENNTASATVGQKSGFQYEGTFRESSFNEHSERFVGIKVFSRLKGD